MGGPRGGSETMATGLVLYECDILFKDRNAIAYMGGVLVTSTKGGLNFFAPYVRRLYSVEWCRFEGGT